jgi:hypothetical protein
LLNWDVANDRLQAAQTSVAAAKEEPTHLKQA